MIKPKFQPPTTSFHLELRSRINAYFADSNFRMTGNIALYLKACILAVSFIAVYVHLIFFTSNILLVDLFECLMLGGLTSAIGFNIMHDGAHGSFSNQKWINDLAALSLNVIGANVFLWKTKHNVIHHIFTNIEGMDDDIDAKPFLRLCETQKRHAFHRFQHLYFWLAYSFLYLYWVFFSDYKKYFTNRIGGTVIKRMNIPDHISFWAFKSLHMVLFVVIPICMVGVVPWVVGFFSCGLFAGLIISIVFQLAHAVEDTQFPTVDTGTGRVEDQWMVHQLKTTANFATKNKIISWCMGGLNFQIEHHLFPQVSHVHYPAISKVVKQLCREYSIPYIEYPKLRLAVASHVSHLRQLGKKQ